MNNPSTSLKILTWNPKKQGFWKIHFTVEHDQLHPFSLSCFWGSNGFLSPDGSRKIVTCSAADVLLSVARSA
jgi:hypothetical protein